jgi:hypothetical protein
VGHARSSVGSRIITRWAVEANPNEEFQRQLGGMLNTFNHKTPRPHPPKGICSEGLSFGGGGGLATYLVINDEHLQRNKVAEQETSKFTGLTSFVPLIISCIE